MFILEASATRDREREGGRIKNKRGRDKVLQAVGQKKAPATEAASQVMSSEVCSELYLLHLGLCRSYVRTNGKSEWLDFF